MGKKKKERCDALIFLLQFKLISTIPSVQMTMKNEILTYCRLISRTVSAK
jgi:hypothetical protein